MTIAILAAFAIEGMLIAAMMSVHMPAPKPAHVSPVMQMRIVKAVTPPPPPPPPPVIRKVVKQQSDLPVPKPVARPAAPVQRHAATPTAAPAPVVPTPVATQEAPSTAHAAPAASGPSTAGSSNTSAAAAAPADIAIVCPVQAKPDMPPRALAEGISGEVTARATIEGGRVARVDIVKSTPPGVFDGSVRRAMAQYQCKVDGGGQVVVEQSFDFTQTD
ncbi:energy transducer TonB (plasmid) [Paraburkholderia sp. FT54]|uniref:energy transducer TonB n=1 Tax=Paraburkholderia sp. FT54 TaxID=3074437 RepID=UPI0028775720|nr:energy transducer TonB [Paraburkholderia sp. FT54]WNC95189.1 energy transducer TonB [Paraburkholderia sp. FT54]